MNIKELSIQEITEIYNTHMINDFPASELKPLKYIVNAFKKGVCLALGLYIENTENNTENILCGYATFIIYKDYNYALLDYFAIINEFRGKQMGHEFFKILSPYFKTNYSCLDGIFIECEAPETALNDSSKDIMKRRISFYTDNNCLTTMLSSVLFSVKYDILYYPLTQVNSAHYADFIHRNDLDYIYRKMFSRNIYKENVCLYERLSDTILSMPATKLAPYLLGKLLCRKIDGKVIKFRITETECYYGEEDTACHAHKGKTERTKVLYEKGGTSYVYLCYGMHNLFNVVSGPAEHPEAVLFRGIEGYDGPGRLTKAMSIDRQLNGIDLTVSDLLWIEDDGTKVKYVRDKRVGIDYATPKYRNILWRFCVKNYNS